MFMNVILRILGMVRNLSFSSSESPVYVRYASNINGNIIVIYKEQCEEEARATPGPT